MPVFIMSSSHGDERATVERDGVVVAELVRGRGLWRDACAIVGENRARGLGAALRLVETSVGPSFALLEIHEGYHAAYRREGHPFARIMRTAAGHAYRRFDPHESLLFDNFEEAAAHARAAAGLLEA